MKLNVKAFGLASGIFWGIGVFALAWWLIIFEGSSGDPTFIGRIYKGFSISPFGSVIGLIWGFFDGDGFEGFFSSFRFPGVPSSFSMDFLDT